MEINWGLTVGLFATTIVAALLGIVILAILQNRSTLSAIGIFSDEQTRSFWMKNTLIDLDIGYFNNKKVLIDIQQMKAENSVMQLNPPAYPSKQPARYALEMSKGWFKKNNFPEGTALKIISRP